MNPGLNQDFGVDLLQEAEVRQIPRPADERQDLAVVMVLFVLVPGAGVEEATGQLTKVVEESDKGVHGLEGGANRHDAKMTVPPVGVPHLDTVAGARSENPIQDIKGLGGAIPPEVDVK